MYTIQVGAVKAQALAALEQKVQEAKTNLARGGDSPRVRRVQDMLETAANRLVDRINADAGELDLISIHIAGSVGVTDGQLIETEHFFLGIRPVV